MHAKKYFHSEISVSSPVSCGVRLSVKVAQLNFAKVKKKESNFTYSCMFVTECSKIFGQIFVFCNSFPPQPFCLGDTNSDLLLIRETMLTIHWFHFCSYSLFTGLLTAKPLRLLINLNNIVTTLHLKKKVMLYMLLSYERPERPDLSSVLNKMEVLYPDALHLLCHLPWFYFQSRTTSKGNQHSHCGDWKTGENMRVAGCAIVDHV